MPAAPRLWLSFLLVFVAFTAQAEDAALTASVTPTPAPGATPEGWLSRGAWTDRVPLDLPPAPGGLAPDIAFVADPGVREGLMGLGWTLAGLSRVERRDPLGGVPEHVADPADALTGSSFRLDGQRLYHNSVTGCFEPEQQDGRCVEYDDEANVWTVRKDGWRWTYGARLVEEPSFGGILTDILDWLWSDSPEESACEQYATLGLEPIHCADDPTITPDVPMHLGESSVWLLAEVRDPYGRKIIWDYRPADYDGTLDALADSEFRGNAQGVPLPERISYGAAEITFEYEPREDWRLDGLGGSFVALTERLVAVEASVDESFYSRFTLNYADDLAPSDQMFSGVERWPDAAQPLSIVTTVRREASSGAFAGSSSKTLRSVTWNDEGDAWEAIGDDLSAELPEALSAEGWVDLPALDELDRVWTRGTVANLNGDGRPDLILVSYACNDISTTETTASVITSAAGGVRASGVSCGVLVRAYVNKPSLVSSSALSPHAGPPSFVLDEEWTDAIKSRLSFDASSRPVAHLFGDVNRDGWTDMLYSPSSATGVGVSMLQFDPLTRSFDTQGLQIWPSQLRAGQLADMNGDGWVDLLVSAGDRNHITEPTPDASHVIFNSGVAGEWLTTKSVRDWFGDREDLALLLPLDELILSGGDPADWDDDCSAYTTYTNYPEHGEGAYPDADTYRSAQARFADFNNDGLLDVAYALYACWDSAAPSDSGGATPVETSAYSRIFYGDGRRRWFDSGLSAGEPWLITADPDGTGSRETGLNHLSDSFFSMVDLNRAGRPALIQYGGLDDDGAPVVRAGYDWGARYGFFEPTGDPWPADVDLGVSGLGGRYPHERQVILADFDGDGFVDQLRLFTERDELLDPDFTTTVSYSVTFHAHTRETTQGRMTEVVGPWGGATELDWGFTANRGGNNGALMEEDDPLARLEADASANRWLHTNEEILVAMDGAEGNRQYRYMHGLHDGERFRGFGVVERHNQAASVEEHGFGVSRPLMGASVYSARYDEDHVLEHLIVNAHAAPMSASAFRMSDEWGLDVRPPYFNPLRRQCVIELDKSEPNPSTVAELVEECFTLPGSVVISWPEWTAALGFLRYPDENLLELLTAIQIADGNDSGAFQAAEGMFPVDRVIPFTGRFDAQGAAAASYGFTDPLTTASTLDTTGTYDGVALPERPAAPAAIAGLTSARFNVTDWEYGERGLLLETTQRRDPYVPDDDLLTAYSYGPRDDDAWGSPLTRVVITSGDGLTPYETTTTADFAPGAFNLPGTITRCGSSTATADCVETLLTWTHGDGKIYGVPASQTFIDGTTETTEVDPTCGLVTQTTDRAGRVHTRTLDSLCRVQTEAFEGALTTMAYDSFNRVTLTTIDPDVDDGDSSDTLTEQHFYEGDLPHDDKATLTSGGRLELLDVDGWGRPKERRSCPGALGSTGVPSCTGDEKVAAWVYLDDGTVGWEILPHFDGEVFEAVAFTHDHAGRVVAQVSPGADGAEALTTWQHAPGVSVMTDPLGVQSRVEFDFLTEEHLLNGLSRRFVVRDAYGRLLSDTDATGLTREVIYDPLHRVAVETLIPKSGEDTSCAASAAGLPTVTSCPALIWETEHDLIGRTVTVTDPLGVASASTFDPVGRIVATWVDGVTLVDITHTDRVGATPASTTTQDETNEEVVTTTDGLGRVISETTLAGTTFTTYGADGLPLSVTDMDGRTRYFERDVWGDVLAICAPSGWDGSACATPLVQHTLDARGRVLTSTDADGVTWTAERGPGGVLQRLLQGAIVLEEHDYDILGRPVWSLVDGVERAFVYDSLGRVTTVTIGDGERVTTLAYDDADRVIGATVSPTHDGGDATTTYDYGAYGWLIGVTEAGESTPRTMLYDPLGHPRAVTEPGGASARRDYDNRGRVIFSQAPGGAPTSLTYSAPHSFDGVTNLLRVESLDGESNVTTTFTDALGRLIGERLPDGTAYRHHFQGSERWAVEHQALSGAPLAMTVTHYDAELGLPVTEWGWFGSPYTTSSPAYADFGLTNPADQVITSAYSAAGRLLELDNGASLTEFSYDADGFLLTESWDDGAQLKSWVRDAFGRPTSETWLGSDALNSRVREFAYDDAGRLTAEAISDSFTGESLTTTWDDLDAYGNAATTERALNGAPLSAWSATYDDQGRLTSRTTAIEGVPVGTLSWAWNDDDTLSAVTTPSGAALSSTTPPAAPAPLERGPPDGATVARDHPPRRQPARRPRSVRRRAPAPQPSLRPHGPPGQAVDEHQHGPKPPALTWEGDYDDRGRLVAEHVTTGSITDTSSYTYAEPGWLTDEQHTRGGAWSRSYDHDAAGNRITQTDGTTTETLTWDGSVVTAIDAAAPILDPFDAVVEEDDLSFLHDPDGELAEVQDASGVLRSILRDPEGRPLAQRNANGDERLTFYGLSHGSLPLEVVTEDGEVITEIVVEGIRFGQQRSGEAKATPIVTDPRGAVLQLGGETLPAFGAFGENTQAPSAFDERHLFAGLESIPESPDVMLAQHRAYHPRTGRFLSPDPLGLAGGMFRTRYAEGDGVNLVDPTGWLTNGLSTNDPSQMEYKDDEPATGTDDSPNRDGGGEGKSFCSENAFACGGNDAGGGDVLRKMLILRQDGEEAEGEVDANSADDDEIFDYGEQATIIIWGERTPEGGDTEGDPTAPSGGASNEDGTDADAESDRGGPLARLRDNIQAVLGRNNGLSSNPGDDGRGVAFGPGRADEWMNHEVAPALTSSIDSVVGNGSLLIVGATSQLASDELLGALDPALDEQSRHYRSAYFDWGRVTGAAGATVVALFEIQAGMTIGAGGPALALVAAPETAGASLALAPEAALAGATLAGHGATVIGSRVARGLPDVPNYHLAKSTGVGASGASAASFPNAEQLAGRLGVGVKQFHKNIKPGIVQDLGAEAKRIGAKNPDIGVNEAGQIVLRNPKTGAVIATDVPLDAYAP
jgi:RHS repeat-associated protein